MAFTERYFPPIGHMAQPAPDGAEPSGTWFPLHLLLEQLGRCSRRAGPAAYILASLEAPACCLPVCDEHVCDLAALTLEGHAGCPKCHMRWVASPQITPEFLAPVLAGGAERV